MVVYQLINNIMTSHESQNIEYKSSWHEDYLKWICGLANACFSGGYIDVWGRGTLKIINACKDAGRPEPEIVEKNGGVSMALFVHSPGSHVEKTSEKIIKAILLNPQITIAELAI